MTKVEYRFFRVGQTRRGKENLRENNVNKLQEGALAQEPGSHRTKFISVTILQNKYIHDSCKT